MVSTSPSRRVLVVEDDEDSAELVVEVLSDAGYVTERVANGRAALDRLEHDPLPSLILLDLHMPIMDGREFRLRQRGSARYGDLPVIIVSADTAATATIDAEYVLRKPFTADLARARRPQRLRGLEREYGRAERLAHLDRLASLGTMAATLGHEISNPLTYVLMSIDFLERELGTPSLELPSGRLGGVLEGLGELRFGADRVRSIVQSLRVAAHGEWAGPLGSLLAPVLSTAAIIAGGEIRTRAQLREALGATPIVQGDETKLTQVFVNLLVNAAQAMRDVTPYRNEIELRCGTDQVGHAVVEIHDTGCGIPDELQARVFDPFFTTKPVGLGTGLGLFVSRSIVEAHGGSITFESEVGRGTTFRVSLPPAPEPQ